MLSPGQLIFLLSSFGRALSHQVRTPLSVISNDLYCIQTQGNLHECRRSLDKCKSISSILSSACVLEPRSWQNQRLNLGDIMKQEFPLSNSQECYVQGDLESMKRCFKLLSELFNSQGYKNVDSKCYLEDGSVLCSFSLTQEDFEVEVFYCSEVLSSFTEFYNYLLGQDGLNVVFIDTLLWSHEAKIIIQPNPQQFSLVVNISIVFGASNE